MNKYLALILLSLLSACAQPSAPAASSEFVKAAPPQCCIAEACSKYQYTDTSGVVFSCWAPNDDQNKCTVCHRAGG